MVKALRFLSCLELKGRLFAGFTCRSEAAGHALSMPSALYRVERTLSTGGHKKKAAMEVYVSIAAFPSKRVSVCTVPAFHSPIRVKRIELVDLYLHSPSAFGF